MRSAVSRASGLRVIRAAILRHRAIAQLLVALALAVRAIVPAGYMPVSGPGGIAISVCSGNGQAAWVDASGKIRHDTAPGGHDVQCPYAAASLALFVPVPSAVATPEPVAPPVPALDVILPGIGTGLAAPPPPATGPPA